MVFLPKEKSQFILFERTRLKKQKQTGKGAKQQRRWNKNSFTKKGWTNEKGGLFFWKKLNKRNQQRKHRERESKKNIARGKPKERKHGKRKREEKKKRKSVENEKTNSKESKHKDTQQKRENKVRRKLEKI